MDYWKNIRINFKRRSQRITEKSKEGITVKILQRIFKKNIGEILVEACQTPQYKFLKKSLGEIFDKLLEIGVFGSIDKFFKERISKEIPGEIPDRTLEWILQWNAGGINHRIVGRIIRENSFS